MRRKPVSTKVDFTRFRSLVKKAKWKSNTLLIEMNCNGLLNMFLCSEPLSGRFQLVKISNDVDDEEFATLTGAHTHIAVVHYGYLFKLIRFVYILYIGMQVQNLYLGNGGTMLLRPEDIGNTTTIYLHVCLTFCLLFRNSLASTSTTSFNCCHYKYQVFCIFFFFVKM